MNQLFARKSLKVLLDEMAGENRLKRVLGPVSLTALGVGAIIGTGIFVLTGLAARNYAGPGLILSFVVAGLACAFAALCYSEFASMAPVAGSAYTYAYTTLGELVAWIIGWDLVLEYAMGSSTVANGWSHYFLKFLGLFKNSATGQALITIPLWLTMDPFTAHEQHFDYQTAHALVVSDAQATVEGKAPRALPFTKEQGVHKVDKVEVQFTRESLEAAKAFDPSGHSLGRVKKSLENGLMFDPMTAPDEKLTNVKGGLKDGYTAYQETPLPFHFTFNAIAIAIVTVITAILVIGIKESARFNAAMVLVKLAAVIFVIGAGIGYVDSSNWSPFLPYGWSGVMGAAGVIFFAYIGFDSISTHAEEAKNPQRDVPIGIITSLAVCTVLYILVAGIVTGMVPYPEIPLDAPIAGVFENKGLKSASVIITVGALTGITSVLLVMLLSQPRVLLAMARDGLLPQSFFGAVHPRFKTPHKSTILTGILSGITASLFPLEALGHMVSIGTLFAFVVVCAAVWIMRFTNPDLPRPFRAPAMHLVAPLGIIFCLAMMISLGWQNWLRLFGWLAVGLVIYFLYSRHHSHLGKELRGELAQGGISPSALPRRGTGDHES
ncbi:MAG: amino acid permease [Planctomycetaceae bacterium]|nr:amino acid permease [Planctomycetaceae bacterium]